MSKASSQNTSDLRRDLERSVKIEKKAREYSTSYVKKVRPAVERAFKDGAFSLKRIIDDEHGR